MRCVWTVNGAAHAHETHATRVQRRCIKAVVHAWAVPTDRSCTHVLATQVGSVRAENDILALYGYSVRYEFVDGVVISRCRVEQERAADVREFSADDEPRAMVRVQPSAASAQPVVSWRRPWWRMQAWSWLIHRSWTVTRRRLPQGSAASRPAWAVIMRTRTPSALTLRWLFSGVVQHVRYTSSFTTRRRRRTGICTELLRVHLTQYTLSVAERYRVHSVHGCGHVPTPKRSSGTCSSWSQPAHEH